MKTYKSVLISLLVLSVLTLVSAQQHKPNAALQSTNETSYVITGSSITIPLMALWQDSYQEQFESVAIELLESHDLSVVDAIEEGRTDIFMYSGLDQDLPEDAGLWQMKVAREAVVPIINSNNPLIELIWEKGLTPNQLIQLFTSETKLTWGALLDTDDSTPVNVYVLEFDQGAAQVWANFLFTKADHLKGMVLDGDEEMIARLNNDPAAIGFCNLKYAYNLPAGDPAAGIRILPIDLNVNQRIDYTERIPEKLKEMQRVIWLGSYPSNLCRPLSLIAAKKPDNEKLIHFLSWILNEGQTIACDNGYCRLRTSERMIQQKCLSQK